MCWPAHNSWSTFGLSLRVLAKVCYRWPQKPFNNCLDEQPSLAKKSLERRLHTAWIHTSWLIEQIHLLREPSTQRSTQQSLILVVIRWDWARLPFGDFSSRFAGDPPVVFLFSREESDTRHRGSHNNFWSYIHHQQKMWLWNSSQRLHPRCCQTANSWVYTWMWDRRGETHTGALW